MSALRPLHSPATIPPTEAPAIAARAISHHFRLNGRDLMVLDDVSIAAAPGEFVAVVGPSGCGKSTLLTVLAGLQRPAFGAVTAGGAEVTGRLDIAAYMPQKDLLLPWKSVLDNAALGLHFQGVGRREARERARELLPRFGLEGFENAFPAALSGGMRQRAALLRTFLTGRPVLLLDEPFGALDALTRGRLQEWLLAVCAEFGRTVVLVTHDVDEALYLADRVYVLTPRPGRVAAELAVPLPRPRRYDEVVTSPVFTALKRRVLGLLSAGQEARP